eukprot:s6678_g4.t1
MPAVGPISPAKKHGDLELRLAGCTSSPGSTPGAVRRHPASRSARATATAWRPRHGGKGNGNSFLVRGLTHAVPAGPMCPTVDFRAVADLIKQSASLAHRRFLFLTRVMALHLTLPPAGAPPVPAFNAYSPRMSDINSGSDLLAMLRYDAVTHAAVVVQAVQNMCQDFGTFVGRFSPQTSSMATAAIEECSKPAQVALFKPDLLSEKSSDGKAGRGISYVALQAFLFGD